MFALDDPALAAACLRHVKMRCPRCGHSLSATSRPVCTECGSPITLFVTASEGIRWPWLSAALLLAVSTGIAGIAASWITYKLVEVGYPLSAPNTLQPWIYFLVPLGSLLAVLITRRRLSRARAVVHYAVLIVQLGATLAATTATLQFYVRNWDLTFSLRF